MPSVPAGESKPIRALLWSIKGAGEHYGGPGMSAYRLYSRAHPGRFRITLAHGFEAQQRYDVFAEQCLIAPFHSAAMGQLRFIHAAKGWIRDNSDRFDVMHGLQGFEATLTPAYEAQKRGLPAVVKLAAHRADLAELRADGRVDLGVPVT